MHVCILGLNTDQKLCLYKHVVNNTPCVAAWTLDCNIKWKQFEKPVRGKGKGLSSRKGLFSRSKLNSTNTTQNILNVPKILKLSSQIQVFKKYFIFGT